MVLETTTAHDLAGSSHLYALRGCLMRLDFRHDSLVPLSYAVGAAGGAAGSFGRAGGVLTGAGVRIMVMARPSSRGIRSTTPLPSRRFTTSSSTTRPSSG